MQAGSLRRFHDVRSGFAGGFAGARFPWFTVGVENTLSLLSQNANILTRMLAISKRFSHFAYQGGVESTCLFQCLTVRISI